MPLWVYVNVDVDDLCAEVILTKEGKLDDHGEHPIHMIECART